MKDVFTYHAEPVLGEAYAIGTYWCLVHKAVHLRSLRHSQIKEQLSFDCRFTEAVYSLKKEKSWMKEKVKLLTTITS